MASVTADAATVATNEFIGAAGLIVQALHILLAAGGSTRLTCGTAAIRKAACAVSAAGVAAFGAAGATPIDRAGFAGVAALASASQFLKATCVSCADPPRRAAHVSADGFVCAARAVDARLIGEATIVAAA
jgi:hypothetical protein